MCYVCWGGAVKWRKGLVVVIVFTGGARGCSVWGGVGVNKKSGSARL